jgi:hypothetical protein
MHKFSRCSYGVQREQMNTCICASAERAAMFWNGTATPRVSAVELMSRHRSALPWNFGGTLGRAWQESPERVGRDQVLSDLMDGQFSDPVRVIVFNTGADHARDVSRESEHHRKGLNSCLPGEFYPTT